MTMSCRYAVGNDPAVEKLHPMQVGGLSPNGEFLLYSFSARETTNVDLWVTPLEGDQASRPFLDSRFNETHGQFSPDGQWVAYESDASGRSEIYVTPFPAREAYRSFQLREAFSLDGAATEKCSSCFS